MAIYIKANPLVAKYLGLTNDRNQLPDGNFLLWQCDIMRLGPLSRIAETAEDIGAVLLTPTEAKQEQDGKVLRPLPTANDPRFIIIEEVEPDNTAEA